MNNTPYRHQVVDAMIPPAMQIVIAVRDDQPDQFLDAVRTAETMGGVGWQTALIIALAGMVPDDRSVGDLTAWLGVA
ncbi:hypothetical protein [Williamsia serinedens]|uniref:Uncharacterized protein n=1 Tax=Williamsia serinedens TaxID=391736 RepID=A0ABT1H7A2_9NOCA|nr:hypothetical protein [Williamsia serinedens]MCP2163127.1 hypothetical protein [Williamsia serinedens]